MNLWEVKDDDRVKENKIMHKISKQVTIDKDK